MVENGEATRRQSRFVRFWRWQPTSYGQAWLLALFTGLVWLIVVVAMAWFAFPKPSMPLRWILPEFAALTLSQGLAQSIAVHRRRRRAARVREVGHG